MLSGAAALFYELIWSQQFSIVFGSSEIATASVLGVYLAGLGTGAALAHGRCRTSRRPLLIYAALEGVIALSALLVPRGLAVCQDLFHRSFVTDALPSASFGTSWLWQLLITVALLALPTLCLGASFPYAIRGLVREDRTAGRTTARLYSANTFGAVTGSLAVGLLVLPRLGIEGSTWAGAALSLAAAGLALTLVRRPVPPGGSAVASPASIDTAFPFVPVVILAGAVSLASQILWTRMLIHIVGSGLYALSILLACFLLGLSLGSLVAGAAGRSHRANAIGFAVAQLWMAVVSWAAFVGLEAWAVAGQPPAVAFEERLLRGAVVASLTLLPMAAGSGAAFLFAINARAGSADEAAPTVAFAYQLTAIGNLAGGIVLALAVFPHLGFGGSQGLLVALSLAAALIAALSLRASGRRWARRALLVATGVLAALLAVLRLPPAHGIQTYSPLTGSALSGSRAAGATTGGTGAERVVFAELGTSASVVLVELEGEWNLRTNGLTEGSIQPPGVPRSRYLVTRWLGLLPFLARPGAEEVLVIGLGAGTTLESVPASVDRLAVVEIEAQVAAANRSVAAERRLDPLADPRLELVVNDARDVLNRTRRRFDVVISQPSHPWTSGAANLYTREFFESVRSRLRPGGVLAQWVGLPFVDEPLLRSVLATLIEVFPEVEVYRPPTGAALILLASEAPLAPHAAALAGGEAVALGIARPEDLAAHWVLSSRGVRRLAEGAPLVTDDRNLLASHSPRILGRALGRTRAREVLAAHDPLLTRSNAVWLDSLDLIALVQRLSDPQRIERLARTEPDPARRQLALSWLPIEDARRRRSVLLTDALELEPRDEVLRAAALELARISIARGAAPPGVLGELTASERLVVAAWRHAGTGEWSAVEALEVRLRSMAPTSPLYWEAVLLRAQWRSRSTRREDLAEALSLLDAHLAHRASAQALLLYAVAADRAGLPVGALAALSDLTRLAPRLRSPSVDAAVVGLLDTIETPPRLSAWAAQIAARARR